MTDWTIENVFRKIGSEKKRHICDQQLKKNLTQGYLRMTSKIGLILNDSKTKIHILISEMSEFALNEKKIKPSVAQVVQVAQ